MNVIIIGYGKIGRSKALIWNQLGLDVYVEDTDRSRLMLALNDGHQLFDPKIVDNDSIIDISTPASQHFNSLKWAISIIKNNIPRAIIVEKPLASSRSELKNFIRYVDTFDKFDLGSLIYVNESYYSSVALKMVCDDIINKKILSTEIELTKNRLIDNKQGRFFDYELDIFGIELPHILAILQKIGINLMDLPKSNINLIADTKMWENQAMHISKENLNILSCLGNFRITNEKLNGNETTIRKIKIETEANYYEISFDPCSGYPRYHSLINQGSKDGKLQSSLISDDHMRTHLSLFINDLNQINRNFIGFKNAVMISDLLISMRETSNVSMIDTSDSVWTNSENNLVRSVA